MRLFVAINFSEELRDRIHRAARPLRQSDLPVRWDDAADYHLTMKFIGRVHDERRDEMAEVVRTTAASYRPFEIEFGTAGAFPSLRRARVIWLGVEPGLELRSLKYDLENAFARHGIDAETRSFHPHVTLGRADPNAEPGKLRPLESLIEEVEVDASAPVSSLELMRSRLRPDGAVHTVESVAPLSRED